MGSDIFFSFFLTVISVASAVRLFLRGERGIYTALDLGGTRYPGIVSLSPQLTPPLSPKLAPTYHESAYDISPHAHAYKPTDIKNPHLPLTPRYVGVGKARCWKKRRGRLPTNVADPITRKRLAGRVWVGERVSGPFVTAALSSNL